MFGWEVDDGDNLGADEVLGLVVVSDLGGRAFCAEFGAEVDSEFVGGFSGLREGFGVGDCSDAEFDFFEVGEGDLLHGVSLAFPALNDRATVNSLSVNGLETRAAT